MFNAIFKLFDSQRIIVRFYRFMMRFSVISIRPCFNSLPTARLNAFLLSLEFSLMISGETLSLNGSTPSNSSITFITASASFSSAAESFLYPKDPVCHLPVLSSHEDLKYRPRGICPVLLLQGSDGITVIHCTKTQSSR